MMDPMHLSDIFRYVQKFGQKGHQIGRKIGDAIEVITYGMIDLDHDLMRHLAIEEGLEGATSAKHKVEFAFYELGQMNTPMSDDITKLFGFIECKKVGVEQTVKQSFKAWQKDNPGKFHATGGLSLTVGGTSVFVRDHSTANPALSVSIGSGQSTRTTVIPVSTDDTVCFALDIEGQFHLLQPGESLHDLEHPIGTCAILHVVDLDGRKVKKILVEDCLGGPQTPEKAKQASFVALDVRKRITGHFDKTADASRLRSILVIGEATHWEPKSRSMVRLCIDDNLVIPDKVVIRFFEVIQDHFGDGYQSHMRKQAYTENENIRDCTRRVIDEFDSKVLRRMDSDDYVRPSMVQANRRPSLVLVPV